MNYFTSFLLVILLCWFYAQCSSEFQVSIKLLKYHHIIFFIGPIKSTLGTNLTLNIVYQSTSLTLTSSLVSIYSSSFIQTEDDFKYSIWNFQNSDQIITITVSTQSNTTLTQNILRMEKMQNRSLIAAAFDKQTSSGYMLPFNMLNTKISSIYVTQYNATLLQQQYNLQLFMSTYWNQLQSNIQIFPHFPYLSQCSIQKSYIILSDLMKPQSCEVDSFYGIICKNKLVEFSCIIEQLQVSNVDLQYWFNKNQQILFYLFKKQLSMQEFSNIKLGLSGTNNLISNVFQDLVPVIYYRQSTNPVIVNQYNIDFRVRIDRNSEITIVSAEIYGYYNKDLVPPYALFHTHVTYLNIFQRFYSYDLPIYYYIAYAFFIDLSVITIIWLTTATISAIDIRKKIEIIIAPALKGCLYTIITGGSFFFIFNQITFQTSFSGITSLYGDVLTNQQLQLNNIGRNGLMVGFIGFYLLNMGIKQSFKITQNDNLKTFFEDDLKLNQNKSMQGQNQDEKIQFTKKNMVSHKKYILMSSIMIIFFGLFCVEIMISLPVFTMGMIILFLVPILTKMAVEQMRFVISKQVLYICGYLLGFILIFIFLILKSKNIVEFTFLYFCKFINHQIQSYIVQLLFEKSMYKIDESSYKIFSKVINFKRKESQYQKSLYLSTAVIILILSSIMTPLICLTLYIISRTNIFESTLLIEQTPMYYGFIMMITLIPMQIYTIFGCIQLLKKYNYRIEEVIKFNHFKFKRRRFSWMNDQFSHSANIHSFYRQYQKFAFSSQLYFVISLIGYSIFLILIGFIIIIESKYSFGYDPAMLLIGIVVISSGDILSFVVSVLGVTKLKLYEKKEDQFIKQNLNKTEKYLKNNDTTDFLQLRGVKEYFISYNKDWIIQNLHRIFERQDLQQNNCQIISKYKHYKSLFKKQQMQQKRKQRELNQTSYNKKSTEIIEQNKIMFNKKMFTLTKPIIYYWFYLAKQNIYLKNIIDCVKKQKIKKNCQFCNMDFQLQALEKKDFKYLVNQFRVLNVNKFFDPQTFLQFYRINQKYITICIECKQKNLHLQSQFTLKQIPSKLVKKWHLVAKSMLLHRKAQER